MLSFISWQQYLLAVGIAGFLYYLVIMLRFYRAGLHQLRKNTRVSADPDPVMGAARPGMAEARLQPELPLTLPENQSPNLN